MMKALLKEQVKTIDGKSLFGMTILEVNHKLRKTLLLVFLNVFAFNYVFSQAANTYSFSSFSGTYTATSGQTSAGLAQSADDALSAPINIGFPFVFENTSYSQFKVSTNGWITFNTSATNVDNSNDMADNTVRPLIAPLWDDLENDNTNSQKYVNYVLTGASPNRVLTIEWHRHRWQYNSGNDVISFQCKLYETSNVIEFHYSQGSNAVLNGTASIGLKGAANGVYYCLNNSGASPTPSNTVNTINISTKPATGQVYRWTPTHIPVIPAPTASNNGPIVCGTPANLIASNLSPGGQVGVFNGTSSTMTSGIGAQTAINNNFTVEMWVNPTGTITIPTQSNTGTAGTSGQRWLVYPDLRGGATECGSGISVGTNGIVVGEHSGGYLPLNLVQQMSLTGWNHIAIVYTARVPSLYVNGFFVKTGVVSGKTTVFPSSGSGLAYGFYQGSVDNIRIWGSSRTEAQIRESMYLTTPATGTPAYQYLFEGNCNDNIAGANNSPTNVTYSALNYFTYTWSGGASLPAASTNTTQATTAGLATTQIYSVMPSIAGNLITGTASANTTVTVTCGPPDVTTIPSIVCVGETITILGTNMGSASSVTVNGVAATIISNTLTQIEVTAPAGAGGTSGNIVVTTGGGSDSQGTITVNALPATPTTPTSNSPQCVSPGVTITRVAPPGGITWYWQTAANGVSTTNSSVTNTVTTGGTYFLRAQDNSSLCWGTSASIPVTITPGPTAVATPSPTNGNTAVCFTGTGAVSSISWAASASATGYDVYFGTSTTPPLVSTNQPGLSYATGTLSSGTTYYWKVVPKNSCGVTDPGTNWSFTTQPTACGYCNPAPTSVDGSGITNVTMNTAVPAGSSINNTTAAESGNYTFFNQTVSAYQGTSQNFSITFTTAGYGYYNKIWVDWNNDGDFADIDEEVFNNGNNESPATTPSVVTGSFLVPSGATPGNHRIRIGGADSGTPIPCYTGSFGTYEDYILNVVAPPACSGTPTAGTASPATQNVASGSTATITLTGTSIATNLTFQWQTSTSAGGTYTNVVGGSGANTNTYTTPAITENAYYRCIVTCTNSSQTSISSVAEVLEVYCTPYSTYSGFLQSSSISNFNTTMCPTNINRNSGYTDGGYNDYTANTASQYQSLNVIYSVTTTAVRGIALWVDWNNNSTFEPSELINSVGNNTANQTSLSGTFTIPPGQAPGNYRMRVSCDFNSNFNTTTPNPCLFTTGTPRGEVEDYTLTVLHYPTCSGAPSPGSILVAANPACLGITTTLNIEFPVVEAGLTYQWQSSDDGVSWTNIPTQNTDFFYARGFKIDITVNDYIKKYRCEVTCSGNTVYTPVLILIAQHCFPTTSTFTVPADFSCVKMSAWGAGGGGGGAHGGSNSLGRNAKAAGGGGGGFTTNLAAVNSGDNLIITIGAGGAGGTATNPATDGSSGGATFIENGGTTVLSANGGAGGKHRTWTGSVAEGTATGLGGTGITTNGGNGGPTNGTNGSGGGGGGGTTANGGNGSATVAGTGGVSGGGAGAAPQEDSGNGNTGNSPGGGGGGARAQGSIVGSVSRAGGNGGSGYATIELPLTIEKGTITNTNTPATAINLCPGGTVSSTGGGSPAVTFGTVTYVWQLGERLGAGDFNFGNWQNVGTGASVSAIDPSYYFPDASELLLVRSVVSSCGALGFPNSATQDNNIWINVDVTNAEITSASSAVCSGGNFTLSGNVTTTGAWTLTLSDGSTVTGTGSGAWSTTVTPSTTTVYTISSMTGPACATSALFTGSSTATVTLADVSSVATVTSATLATGDLLWSGNASTVWGTNTNWYEYNGTDFIASTVTPTNTRNVFILPSTTPGICINATNNTTVTAAGSADNVFIGAGATMNINAGQILDVHGDWTNNGTFNPAVTSTVQFTGGIAQSVGGTSANNFANMSVNKSANAITLDTPISVSETLTMTAGDIVTSSTNVLTVGTSTVAPGSVTWTNGSVVGPLRRYFSGTASGSQTSGIFPVGLPGLNRYAQLNYTGGLSTGGIVTATYRAGACPVGYSGLPTTVNGQLVQNYEEEGYWEIEPNGGDLNTATYSLILRGNQLSTVNSVGAMANLRIIKSSGPSHTSWDNTGIGSHNAPVGSPTDLTIMNTGLSGFSFFNIGSDVNSPLPVELISFSGICTEKGTELTWQTASESNNDYFIVQRSRDGINWEDLTSVSGNGNSTQLINYDWLDEAGFGGMYYRLTQVDFNGDRYEKQAIYVNCESESTKLNVYPNPTQADFTVEVNSTKEVESATISIIDVTGKALTHRNVEIHSGVNTFNFDEKLESGSYLIRVSIEGEIQTLRLVVKN